MLIELFGEREMWACTFRKMVLVNMLSVAEERKPGVESGFFSSSFFETLKREWQGVASIV